MRYKKRFFRWYAMKHTVNSMIERTGVFSMRFNHVCFGLGYLQNERIPIPWLYRLYCFVSPLLVLNFFGSISGNGRRTIFYIKILTMEFSYVTKGEATKPIVTFLWWTYNKYGR